LFHAEWRYKITHHTKQATRRAHWKPSTVRRYAKACEEGESVGLYTNWHNISRFAWARVEELYYERVSDMQQSDCDEEGRPDLAPVEWVDWYANGDQHAVLLVIKFKLCCS
jgi:hypothetical protein